MRRRRSFALKIVPKNFVFDFLNEVAVNENGFEWSVEVLFHNLKGYDGMFVLEELFDSIVWSRIKSVWEPNSYLWHQVLSRSTRFISFPFFDFVS